MKAYDHVRSGVSHVRWEQQDADKFAPSPYSGRGGGNVRKTDARAPVPTPWHMPTHHLVTHAVAVGMTGSGKTGASPVVERGLMACLACALAPKRLAAWTGST